MAMMQRLRDNTHLILWALLVLFLLSMTIGGLVGGANITDLFTREKKLQGKAGIVNGVELEGMQYSQMIQNQLDQYRENGQEITESLVQNISDQVWQSFIHETLVAKQVKRLGLQATDSEIYDYLLQYPPEFIMNQEVFLTDGKFDYQKYYNALTNPQGNEWIGVEQYLRGALPFQKVRSMVENLAIIPDQLVHDEYVKTKVPFTIETLFFPFSLVSSDSFEVTDSEIGTYYKKHVKDYLVPETREMDYVYFELKPSALDSTLKFDLASELKGRIKAGEAFETVATEYTEDPSGKNNGGDLGWFDRDQMVKPFSDAAFSLKKGEISDPVLTSFGYHIIKVEDRRVQDGQTQVKARHILLKINPGPETLDNIRSSASLFAFDAGDIGFEAAADSHNIAIKSTGPLNEDNPYIAGFGSFKKAVRFAFGDNPVGTISELLSADNGYVVFKLTKATPEYYKSVDAVADAVKASILTTKRSAHLKEIAKNIQARIDESTSLQSIAQANKGVIFNRNENQTLDRPLKGISRSDLIIGTVLALENGQVSPPVKIGNQYIILKRISAGEVDESDYAVEKAVIRDRLLKQAKTNYYNAWVAEMTKQADIIDNRENMY